MPSKLREEAQKQNAKNLQEYKIDQIAEQLKCIENCEKRIKEIEKMTTRSKSDTYR